MLCAVTGANIAASTWSFAANRLNISVKSLYRIGNRGLLLYGRRYNVAVNCVSVYMRYSNLNSHSSGPVKGADFYSKSILREMSHEWSTSILERWRQMEVITSWIASQFVLFTYPVMDWVFIYLTTLFQVHDLYMGKWGRQIIMNNI